MADEYGLPSFFSDDPRTGALTYEQLQARRKIAIALAARNRPYPKTIGEGLTALGEGLGEGYFNRNLDSAEAAQRARDTAATRSLDPAAPRPAPGGASLEGDPNAAVADATETKQPLTTVQASAQPQMPIEEWQQRVARNESGSRKDAYTLVGERSRRGDYPYGKYQVMGENVPVWTKKYLGKEMTPQEFLADPDAQEQVARGKGSEYLAKYGPEGAAAAWFAGEKGMNDPNRKDTLGTHVAEYRRRFNIPLVSRDQVVASAANAPVDPESAAPFQVASLGGGVPRPDTAPDQTREAVAQSLTGPPPQQVAQAAPPVGPTPSPVPPNAVPQPLTPQAVPPPPAQEVRPVEPGLEPRPGDYIRANPQLQQQMQTAKRLSLDQSVSPHVQAQADAVYKELEKRGNDADQRAWTVWHENTTKKRDWELGAEQRNLATAKSRGEVYDAAEKRALSDRLGGRDPEAWFKNLDQEKDAVSRQGHMLSQIAFAESAINAGVISGFGADARINLAKMRDWMFNNKIEGDLASNTERLQAAAKSMLGQAVQNIQGKDPRVSEGDVRVASGTIAADPSYQLATMKKILQDNKRVAIRSINDYEDKVDNYLAGHRSERNYQLPPIPTDPSGRYTSRLLEHRGDHDGRKEYDKYFGEGAADLEIARAKRREKRGGG